MARTPRTLIALILSLALTGGAAPLFAQGEGGDPASAVLVLNQERLLSQSLYGQRIQREVEAAGAVLAAENRQIEAQLTEEELALTERRSLMTPEDFRPIAEEFDTRVNGIRAAQEAKGRALQQQAEAAQQAFFETVFPILVEILRNRGASVLMDNRALLLSADGIDITEEAIALIDARLGEGGDAPLIDLDGTVQGATPTDPPTTAP
ncbi:OmpH family outer membrane protein [Roseicyclus marinus]|uniref:OmpH family outer membrane protein n=1 Tax=Roseicyclus marinus TaxID=2161673 RepID=UPI00240F5274|nr:OmpH family outer membrane protein [Roseicyclus marinus]MDG3040144.1 OmpH family outer membrane protein [Roseicyclus marinus]